MTGPMRVLAELLEPVETETPYGGRSVSYESLGMAWLALGLRRARERVEDGATRETETLEAETRSDPRLAEGRVLRFGGADRAIATVAVDPTRLGRSVLKLERDR